MSVCALIIQYLLSQSSRKKLDMCIVLNEYYNFYYYDLDLSRPLQGSNVK